MPGIGKPPAASISTRRHGMSHLPMVTVLAKFFGQVVSH
jgi:hypothetical protein